MTTGKTIHDYMEKPYMTIWTTQNPYMTTGKTITLTIWTTVGKVISLLFNMLLSFESVFLMLSTTSLTAITWSKLESNVRGLTGMLPQSGA